MIKLFKHQEKVLEFENNTPYCLDMSEPGCGKTFPAILSCKDKGKCLVVCPSYLQYNWISEIDKVLGESAAKWPKSARITIMSVDSIYKDATPFHNLDVLVMDEASFICHLAAKRTKCFHYYVQQFKPKKLILLSGTPMKSRVGDLYSILRLFDYHYNKGFVKRFPTQWSYNLRYSHQVKKRFGGREIITWEGSKNIPELKSWLEGRYVKFTLDELEDLPDVTIEEMVVESKESKKLDVALESGWQEMELGRPPSAAFATLKMENALLKVPAAIEIIQGLLDAEQGPLVVFSDHREPVQKIAGAFTGGRFIRGGISNTEREEIVKDFQLGKIPVLVGTIKSMNMGLTLTKSNTLIFVDKNYLPNENLQAMRRIQRVSQTRKCRVIELVRKGIDARINRALKLKEEIIAEVIGGS